MRWINTRTTTAVLTGPTARKSAVAILDQGMLSVTNFLITFMLARLCSKEEFGAYALAFSVMLVANGLQASLVTGPMTVLGAGRQGNDWRSYATSMVLAQLILSATLSALVFSACGVLAWLGVLSGPLAGTFLTMGGVLFFVQGQEFCRKMLFTRLRAWRVLLNDACCCSLQIGGVLALWRFGGGSWRTGMDGSSPGFLDGRNVLLCMGVSTLVGMVLGLSQMRDYFQKSLEQVSQHLRSTWNFGRWTLGTFLSAALSNQGCTWMIGGVSGLTGVGEVEAARLLLAPLQVLTIGGPGILGPRAAAIYNECGGEALRRFIWRLVPVWVLMFAGYGLLVALWPRFWLSLVYGTKYCDIGLALLLWVGVYASVGFGVIASLILAAVRRPDMGMFSGLSAGIVGLGICFMALHQGGPQWGVAGILSSRAANCTMLWVFAIIILHRLRQSPR